MTRRADLSCTHVGTRRPARQARPLRPPVTSSPSRPLLQRIPTPGVRPPVSRLRESCIAHHRHGMSACAKPPAPCPSALVPIFNPTRLQHRAYPHGSPWMSPNHRPTTLPISPSKTTPVGPSQHRARQPARRGADSTRTVRAPSFRTGYSSGRGPGYAPGATFQHVADVDPRLLLPPRRTRIMRIPMPDCMRIVLSHYKHVSPLRHHSFAAAVLLSRHKHVSPLRHLSLAAAARVCVCACDPFRCSPAALPLMLAVRLIFNADQPQACLAAATPQLAAAARVCVCVCVCACELSGCSDAALPLTLVVCLIFSVEPSQACLPAAVPQLRSCRSCTGPGVPTPEDDILPLRHRGLATAARVYVYVYVRVISFVVLTPRFR